MTTSCFREAWRPDGGFTARRPEVFSSDSGGGGATTMPYASCHLQCSAGWLGTRVT
ncbi:hypothetical protein PUN28_008872 [Cardiocondyla obscurior]|uniref:Uncharacterized protein n=1 Tax=Cardiocondyla obscurior TaxID=286306 RepID=A0AAW2FUV1_9HYME